MTAPLLKLTSTRTVGEATLLRDALRLEGIEAELRGEHRGLAAGELPLGETEVELWCSAVDQPRALALLAATKAVDASASVRCEKCLELSPQNFEVCWKCQTPLNARASPVPDVVPKRAGGRGYLIVLGLGFAVISAALGYWAGARVPAYGTATTLTRWDTWKTCMQTVQVDTGNRVFESCDANRDGVFEVERRFGSGGALLSENFDENASGIPERWVSFAADGRRAAESFDQDENGIVERELTFSAYGDSVKVESVDADQNGRWEKLIEHRADGLVATWLDSNNDGLLDRRELSRDGVKLLVELDDGAAGFKKQ